ncbi:MAG: hypothetical protein P9X24_06685, partial [Candidatus Hatepunaea meridiana]|nr:hypothetical protein [Candidatus Hatepunaea meridiana]
VVEQIISMKQDLALGKRVFFFYLSSKQFLINAVTLILLQKPHLTNNKDIPLPYTPPKSS